MAKIIVEDFTKDDELVVNDKLLSGQGEAPPAPPPEEPAEYNHFNDFMDKKWGRSFTFRDGLETVHFSNTAVEVSRGNKSLKFGNGDVGGRQISFANGSNDDSLGPVEFYFNNKKIGEGSLHQTGSASFMSTDEMRNGEVTMKFLEGGSSSDLQCNAYPG